MRSSSLSANVVEFCRMLREHDFAIGPAEEADALRAISLIRIENPGEFHLALRTILAGSRREQQLFDRLYDVFWQGKLVGGSVERESVELIERAAPRPILLSWDKSKNADPPKEQESSGGYSPSEVVALKDFSQYGEEDLEEAIQVIHAIARILANRLSRQYRVSPSRQLDFRRTLRASLRRGGEVIDLLYRKKRKRQTRIVVLSDVSGSMDRYSRFLLTFIYALQRVYNRIETFVFSTSLCRVTELLRRESLPDALREISLAFPEWSGGTRIGQSFETFLSDYGSSLLGRDTVVMILSDGWDIGGIDLMVQSVKNIRQKAERVLWLNPLLGSPEYEPNCIGMQAALPYVDEFLPIHNLESLRELCSHLVQQSRRQRVRLAQ
jgi:uncharacterized protein